MSNNNTGDRPFVVGPAALAVVPGGRPEGELSPPPPPTANMRGGREREKEAKLPLLLLPGEEKRQQQLPKNGRTTDGPSVGLSVVAASISEREQ